VISHDSAVQDAVNGAVALGRTERLRCNERVVNSLLSFSEGMPVRSVSIQWQLTELTLALTST
jgi:hypothetical protein